METGAHELISEVHTAGDLAIVSFRGTEEMSRPYRFDVLARCSIEKSADLERDLLGQRVHLLVHGRATRAVHGIVNQVELGGTHAATGERVRRIRIVPRFAILRRTRRSRIFQDRTVPAIVGDVLTGARVAHRFDLLGTYAPRVYCVQYEESDFDFVARLLAEEGIYYRFSHAEGASEETMILTDTAELLPPIDGDRVLAHREAGTSQSPEDDILSFRVRSRLRPGRVELRDWDFRRPAGWEPGVAETPPEPLAFEQRTLEVYEHHGDFEAFDASSGSARRRLEQLRARAQVAEGESRCRRLVPGQVFKLASMTLPELEGSYTVLRIEHEGHNPEATRSGEAPDVYRNRFAATPAAIPPRPRRRPRRVQQSTETATVVGPPGKEIHTDEHGRVRVRFHWDRDGGGADASCWMRTVQSWSGPGWGAQFIPRIGMEVVVLFVGGDVDKPLVAGCVPNMANRVPFPLPRNRSKSGIRSQSTPGGGGYNEISFEDRTGYEQIHMHAQKDLDVVVNHDHVERVGHDATQQVEQHSFLVVGVNRLETVGADRTTLIGANERTVIEQNRSDVVRGNEERVVEHDRSDVVRGSEERVVEGPFNGRYLDGRTVHVEQGDTETVHDSDKTVSVEGRYEIEVDDSFRVRRAGTEVYVEDIISAESPTKIELIVGGNTIAVQSDGKMTLTATAQIELVCGSASLLLKSDGTIQASASTKVEVATGSSLITVEAAKIAAQSTQVDVDGSSMVNIKGGMVNLN